MLIRKAWSQPPLPLGAYYCWISRRFTSSLFQFLLPSVSWRGAGIVCTTLLAYGSQGCRHTRSGVYPKTRELQCWSLFRTTVPPEEVARHYAAAFAARGLRVTSSRRQDTIYVHAGPSILSDGPSDVLYDALVETERQRDSTRVRLEAGLTPTNSRAWSTIDTTAARHQARAFCELNPL